MPRIALTRPERVLTCPDGANLYSCLAAEGLLDGPCGGRGVCGKCTVEIDGIPTLSCTYCVQRDITVTLAPQAQAGGILSEGFMKPFTPDPGERGTCGVAADIGTTTVVGALFDLFTGEELAALSCLNGQNIYGQDVISRIQYAIENERGTEALQRRIVGDLNAMLALFTERFGIESGKMKRMAISGNTTMIHLLAGYNPASLAAAPYRPAFTGPLTLPAKELGLQTGDGCAVYCLPAISSFVGGDITAGIAACGVKDYAGNTLFMDIGTNGEIVLNGEGRLYCCSCAAGPALEGMNISCGMRAAAGAIEAVRVTEAGRIHCETIGGAEPKGLCGSGLLSAVAALRGAGAIGKNGRFTDHALVRDAAGRKRVVLAESPEICLTQSDVRQVQLAKGAILSGVLTLLEAVNLSPQAIDRVIVAGQFGAHLTAESLTGSGILPEAWQDVIVYAGNTAKSGAALCLLSAKERQSCEEMTADVRYIELSTLPDYQKIFVDCLNF
jgi:uncharacterized 2Fe-2S/4Fe-4S cluster protein (DUF4445 family)